MNESMKREEIISKITAIAEQAAVPAGIEVVEVELKGSHLHRQAGGRYAHRL
jgi:hypothetical protein